jgi:hypothetical protein
MIQLSNTPVLKGTKKAIPTMGCGDLQGWEMLRISHSLDSWLIVGGEVVSLTHRPCCTPQKLLSFPCFWYSFLLAAELNPGPSAARRIRQIGEGGTN